MQTYRTNPGSFKPTVKYIAIICRLLFFFLSFSCPLLPLDPAKAIDQYNIQVWDMKSSLPGNAVYSICQTQNGFLWIGTGNGLVRFDGISFDLYNRGNTTGLEDNQVRVLYEDRDKILWIGTRSGGLTRFKNNRFTTTPVSTHKFLEKIYAIAEDKWGNLWIGSFTSGITMLDKSSGIFTNYTTSHGLPDNRVKTITKDASGDLWITTYRGIIKLTKPGEFEVHVSQQNLPVLMTASLFLPESKELLIGTGDHGLVVKKDNRFTSYGVDKGLPHNTVTSLFRDSRQNVWIGTDGGGLTRMSNGVFTTLSTQNGLADNSVYPVYEDREGSLWVGTLGGGIHQIKDNNFTVFTAAQGLTNDHVVCIHQDRAGNIRAGTMDGLNLLDSQKGTVKASTKDPNHRAGSVIPTISEDDDHTLWIATRNGLRRIKDGKTTIFTKEDGLSDNRVWCLLTDRKGYKWIGTENGLNRFNPKNDTFSTFTTQDGLSGNFIKHLFQDSRGYFWVITDSGLNRFRDETLTTHNPVPSLAKRNLICMLEDKEGALWLGTGDGLLRWQEDHKRLDSFTIRSGLIENHINSILEDEQGSLWLGGPNGISRIEKTQLTDYAKGKIQTIHPHVFNEKNGMKSRWCTAQAIKTQDGRFWFPTSMGVAVIDPNHIIPAPLPIPLYIKNITIDGEVLDLYPNDTGQPPVTISPGKKRLEFYYTAPSFINPQRIRFKSRLKGYDDSWEDKKNSRSATYTNLSPGDYTFEVMATNTDGIWNTTNTSVSFYLQPYFHQTPWFYILISVLLLVTVFLIHYLKVRQLRARKKELQNLVQTRTRDLEERNIELGNTKSLIESKNLQLQEQSRELEKLDKAKSHFFANISHEFRTPLTLIKGPLEQILSQEPDKKLKTQAHMMLRNSRRLMNLVDQLLELAKFDSGKMKLQAISQNVVRFLENIVLCFNPLAEQNQVQLTFQPQTDEIPLCFDPEKMERIIINLLSNAFNYTPANGKITVSVRTVNLTDFPSGCVEITISDTGTGIPEDWLPHIFDRFYHGETSHEYRRKGTGIGLALTKELMEMHHGRIEICSSVKGESRGTQFILRLPFGTEHFQPDEINDSADSLPELRVPDYIPDYEPGGPEDSVTPTEDDRHLILVVDDNADVRKYIRSNLEPEFKVIEAPDGKEGIKKAGELFPDLVISDIIMPETDGYELCARLKKDIKTSHIPIILLTAKASQTSIMEGLETGAVGYITKPFNADLLIYRIRNLIRLRQQLQIKFQQNMMLQPAEIKMTSIDREFLKELQGLVEANLSNPDFDIQLMTKKLHISRSTLKRKIKALTGESPSRFVRSYRLKRAAQLLKSNFGNVTEVAFEVGFSSTAYFTKCFKEQFHQLPHDYRQTEAVQKNQPRTKTNEHG